eukprot:UC4_evm1s452
MQHDLNFEIPSPQLTFQTFLGKDRNEEGIDIPTAENAALFRELEALRIPTIMDIVGNNGYISANHGAEVYGPKKSPESDHPLLFVNAIKRNVLSRIAIEAQEAHDAGLDSLITMYTSKGILSGGRFDMTCQTPSSIKHTGEKKESLATWWAGIGEFPAGHPSYETLSKEHKLKVDNSILTKNSKFFKQPKELLDYVVDRDIPVVKLLVFCSEDLVDDNLLKLRKKIGASEGHVIGPMGAWNEVIAAGCNKAAALKWMAKELFNKENLETVVSFGESKILPVNNFSTIRVKIARIVVVTTKIDANGWVEQLVPDAEPRLGANVEIIPIPARIEPSAESTNEPTTEPSAEPTNEPTTEPSAEPTNEPTTEPSAEPTNEPTTEPSAEPTNEPTSKPSTRPTAVPTIGPTNIVLVTKCEILLSSFPSRNTACYDPDTRRLCPVSCGICLTSSPTTSPTSSPTSLSPTGLPTMTPSGFPTSKPSSVPTEAPSNRPSSKPSFAPSTSPSNYPSSEPSSTPSNSPSGSPSHCSGKGDDPDCPSLANRYSADVNKRWDDWCIDNFNRDMCPIFCGLCKVPTFFPSQSPTFTEVTPSVSPSIVFPTSLPTVSPSRTDCTPEDLKKSWQNIYDRNSMYSRCDQVFFHISHNATLVDMRCYSGDRRFLHLCPVTCGVCVTKIPTSTPSSSPSATPSGNPSQTPTMGPSPSPSSHPSIFPSQNPSARPSATPSLNPTGSPSISPTPECGIMHDLTDFTACEQDFERENYTVASFCDSEFQKNRCPVQCNICVTKGPSESPSRSPTANPTTNPTKFPSSTPSRFPSSAPSQPPSVSPSAAPSAVPSTTPSTQPTLSPSLSPTPCYEIPDDPRCESPHIFGDNPQFWAAWCSNDENEKLCPIFCGLCKLPTPTIPDDVKKCPAIKTAEYEADKTRWEGWCSSNEGNNAKMCPIFCGICIAPTASPTIPPTKEESKPPTYWPSTYPTIPAPTIAPTLPECLDYQLEGSWENIYTIPGSATKCDVEFPYVSSTPAANLKCQDADWQRLCPIKCRICRTFAPSMSPSAKPTAAPSAVPSLNPTLSPSFTPTESPFSAAPTNFPSSIPTYFPSAAPTASPTNCFERKEESFCEFAKILDEKRLDEWCSNLNNKHSCHFVCKTCRFPPTPMPTSPYLPPDNWRAMVGIYGYDCNEARIFNRCSEDIVRYTCPRTCHATEYSDSYYTGNQDQFMKEISGKDCSEFANYSSCYDLDSGPNFSDAVRHFCWVTCKFSQSLPPTKAPTRPRACSEAEISVSVEGISTDGVNFCVEELGELDGAKKKQKCADTLLKIACPISCGLCQTIKPTISPTQLPTAIPTRLPSVSPTGDPTKYPSHNPTSFPTKQPSPYPTLWPTKAPSLAPTLPPTDIPTQIPSSVPTKLPTSQPTRNPSPMPTMSPTNCLDLPDPKVCPTMQKNVINSENAAMWEKWCNITENKNMCPIFCGLCPPFKKTSVPSASPTFNPSTLHPTSSPSLPLCSHEQVERSWENILLEFTQPAVTMCAKEIIDYQKCYSDAGVWLYLCPVHCGLCRTEAPTFSPTLSPSLNPTLSPSLSPTVNPTLFPTKIPTMSPSASPTVKPSSNPSNVPSYGPTDNPTLGPTNGPTKSPTLGPTRCHEKEDSQFCAAIIDPSVCDYSHRVYCPRTCGLCATNPTFFPSSNPSFSPTASPSIVPSVAPSAFPSASPSTPSPSMAPSISPTNLPTDNPTYEPSSAAPSLIPSQRPTHSPTFVPSSLSPSASPTTEVPSSSPSRAPTNTPVCESNYMDSTICPVLKLFLGRLSARFYAEGDSPVASSWPQVSNGVCGGIIGDINTCMKQNAVSYSEAKYLCESQGARLCSKEEYAVSGEAVNTGCRLDRKHVWTSTSCGNGKHVAVLSDKFPSASDIRCELDGSNVAYGGRCCVDVNPECKTVQC